MLFWRKIKLFFLAILGYIYKALVDIYVLRIPVLSEDNGSDIIVSLTSYGRRVSSNVVYYTLVSLLRQNVQPSKIILWLAENEWTDDFIPTKLWRLKEKGVEIRYCKDIKSYKKLIPTLQLFPNNTIITVDDDVIYSKDTISALVKEHQKYPRDIICLHAAKIIIEDGIPCHYKKWPDLCSDECGELVFPIGEGGVLYPSGCFTDDILRQELFTRLCPIADDIWFWTCGLLNGTQKRFVTKSGNNMSLDSLYQQFHKGAALTHSNRFENINDMQFKCVFSHYNKRINNQGKVVSII